MSREQAEICWEVILNGEVVDYLDFPAGLKPKQVRKALIAQGYDSNIRVRKN